MKRGLILNIIILLLIINMLSFTSAECEDTDGGKDYYVFGMVTNGSHGKNDYCVSYNLYEQYCENNSMKTEIYQCPNDCDSSKGVCFVETQGNTCADSDGNNTNLKGTVTYGESEYHDYCAASGMGPDIVAEYYCEDNVPTYYTKECEGECLDGACTTYDPPPNNNPDTLVENWTCTIWSICANGRQTRTCTDSNNLGKDNNKPSIVKECAKNPTNNNSYNQQSNLDNLEDIQNKSYIGDKEVIIERVEGTSVIKIGNESVRTNLTLIEEQSKVFVKSGESKREIKVSIKEAKEKAKLIKEIEKITIIDQNDKIVYSIEGKKRSFLFFIIPLKAGIRQSISVDEGDIVNTEKPWWRFFAMGI
jgi:hypothetical protein